MIYEIRLYTVVPGRMCVALERFERHLPALFARHGICNVGSWIATAGPNGPMFVYIMAYGSLAEREAQWDGFYVDPDWAAVRAETQGNEEATERYDILLAKASQAWPFDARAGGRAETGVQDLLLAEAALGRGALVNAYLADTYLPAIERMGGRILMLADLLAGAALPRIALMVGWDDAASRQRAWTALATDDVLNDAIARQRRDVGRALLPSISTYLLQPTGFRRIGAPLGIATPD